MKWPPIYRLPGATLVEVLVAMSLISVVFVIGSQVVVQLNGPDAPQQEHTYRLQARELLQQMETGREVPEMTTSGAVSFHCERIPHDARRDLYHLRVRCLASSGKALFVHQKIVHLDEI